MMRSHSELLVDFKSVFLKMKQQKYPRRTAEVNKQTKKKNYTKNAVTLSGVQSC